MAQMSERPQDYHYQIGLNIEKNAMTLDESQNKAIDPFKNIGFQNQSDELINQNSSYFQPQVNVGHKHVFKEGKFHQKSGNTPRCIVDLFVQYYGNYKHKFSPPVKRYLQNSCRKLKQWHLSERKNVYKLSHLLDILKKLPEGGNQGGQVHRQLRKTIRLILNKHSIQNMKRPKSQIKNKVHYLRVLRIYQLRCRSKVLIERNQTR